MKQPVLEIDEIFYEASQRSTGQERERYLDSACAGNAALHARVKRLLAVQPAVVGFLEAPAPDPAPTTASSAAAVGTQIGPYKLLEQIGEGGMGVVYVAEQTEPVRRRVALKIIKPGMDTKQVIARFEAERQALAMMEHPNIAKILDAGTVGNSAREQGTGNREQGERNENSPTAPVPRSPSPSANRPYFVMELVRGIPITEFCDQQHLSVPDRLKLVIDVCHAVQHAHQKGIIHRDLKPSNILVTLHDGTPVVKVIDFGVAKAMSPLPRPLGEGRGEGHTIYTAHLQLVGTPLYMSPEQAELSNLDVDTRADVYSLGVLLYELLTGHTPFDKETLSKAGFDEMRRIIREDEPPRPSRRLSTLNAQAVSTVSQHRSLDERKLTQVLRGELDWIVMKALEKDRARRYESASAFAADIQRYLHDEPVHACPPIATYRFRKFAGKHRTTLTTAAVVLVALFTGTALSAWQAIRATEAQKSETTQRLRAETGERKANQNFQFSLDAIDQLLARAGSDEMLQIPGTAPFRRKMFEDAIAYYEQMETAGDNSANIRRRVGQAWIDAAAIPLSGQGRQECYDKGITTLEQLVAQKPEQAENWHCLADAYIEAAVFYRVSNKFDKMEEMANRCHQINERLTRADADRARQSGFAGRREYALIHIAHAAYVRDNHDEARHLVDQAIALVKTFDNPNDGHLWDACFVKGMRTIDASPAEGAELFRQAISSMRTWVAGSSKQSAVSFRRHPHDWYAQILHSIALKMAKHYPDEAAAIYAEATDVKRKYMHDFTGGFSRKYFVRYLHDQANHLRRCARSTTDSDRARAQLLKANALLDEAIRSARRLALFLHDEAFDPTKPTAQDPYDPVHRETLARTILDKAQLQNELRQRHVKSSATDKTEWKPSDIQNLLSEAIIIARHLIAKQPHYSTHQNLLEELERLQAK